SRDRRGMRHLVNTSSRVVVIVRDPIFRLAPVPFLAMVHLQHDLAVGVRINEVFTCNRIVWVGGVMIGENLNRFSVPSVVALAVATGRVTVVEHALATRA